jgi:methylglutaconyl-CoA hydratase
MGFKYLNVSRDGHVERVALNRPDVRNALNEGLIAELTWWGNSVACDGSVHVIVLEGEGPSFCAGADLETMARVATFTHEQNIDDGNEMARMFHTLDRLPVPVIGRVHGAALGGGVGLVAVCDIVVAADDAVFGFTEVRLGLIPAVIAPYVLAKIGRSAARELFLTGERFNAARANTLGLVHSVVPAAALDEAVQRYIDQLALGAPGALCAAKQLIAEIGRRGATDVASLCAEAIASRRASLEGQEGLRAFLEKRKPNWTAAPVKQP